jgi:hypothetical protein
MTPQCDRNGILQFTRLQKTKGPWTIPGAPELILSCLLVAIYAAFFLVDVLAALIVASVASVTCLVALLKAS